jgi:light-regulated signal transduction histidine kinase (bacteriophytochrome)
MCACMCVCVCVCVFVCVCVCLCTYIGHSTLRRAHKCHLEYLENMGVTASIAVALVVREQLWGLVIGHHWTPKVYILLLPI